MPSEKNTRSVRRWIQISITASVVAATLTGCGSHTSTNNAAKPGSQGSPSAGNGQSAASKWMKVNNSTHTVTLTLYGAMHGRLNFNGYANGFMTITIPKNWHVNVKFINKGELSNSAVVAALSTAKQKTAPTPAFSGAATKNPKTGQRQGSKDSFTFVANKIGKYAIISGVPGYGTSGMWDHFNVVSATQKPSLAVKKQ